MAAAANFFHFFNYSFVYDMEHVGVREQLVLSSHHVGFGDQSEVIWLGSKYLYPLGHLASPWVFSLEPHEVGSPKHVIMLPFPTVF